MHKSESGRVVHGYIWNVCTFPIEIRYARIDNTTSHTSKTCFASRFSLSTFYHIRLYTLYVINASKEKVLFTRTSFTRIFQKFTLWKENFIFETTSNKCLRKLKARKVWILTA